MTDAQEKMSKARAQLSREHPFFGAHLLAMNFIETDTIPTMATNYFDLLWNRQFVDTLSVGQIKGVLVHEALHRIFLHPFRLKGRVQMIANMAMDFAINPYVKETGLELPADTLDDTKWHSLTWEQIYIKLLEQAESNGKGKKPKPQSWGEVVSPSKDGKEMSESEARDAELEASNINRAMYQAAKMAGQVPGKLDELISEMLQPEIDYDLIISQIFEGAKPSGYSLRRPSKSALHNFGIYASGRNRAGAGTVGIGFDTSGSITTVEAMNVLGIINDVMTHTKPDQVVVVQFDHAVQDIAFYDGSSDIPDIQIHGRGGTSFVPQFEYIAKECIDIDQYLVVTDGDGDFPKNPPPFPVTWLMTTDIIAPWGTTVRFRVKNK